MSSETIVLADRVLQVPPSPTLAVNAKAKKLRAAAADILNFSGGVGRSGSPTVKLGISAPAACSVFA